VHLEIIATTYCLTIIKTDVFSLHSYRCINIATHLHWVYLDWLQAEFESNSRCTWRWQSCELHNTLEIVIEWVWRWTWRQWLCQLEGCNQARLEIYLKSCEQASVAVFAGRQYSSESKEMHFEAIIKLVWGCTCGGHDRANLLALIEGVWRYTYWLWLSEFGDAHGGRHEASWEIHTWRLSSSCELSARDRASLETNMEATIVWTARMTLREPRDSFGGRDRARLDEYLEAFGGQCVRHWNFTHQIIHSPLAHSLRAVSWRLIMQGGRPEAEDTFRCQLVIIRMKGRHTICGGLSIQCMLYSVGTVLGVCGTRCMVYLLHTRLSVCCTRCKL